MNIAASLADELNTFYARFEADNTAHTENAPAAAAEEVSPLSLSVADVTRSFKRPSNEKPWARMEYQAVCSKHAPFN